MSRFDDIIGYDNVKTEILRYCDVLKNLEKYKALGVSTPCGLMLYGDPGVGKSLFAKSLIEESGLKAYIIRKDKPDGEFVKYIQETFEKAKNNSPAIVMLDDMDKFANEDKDHKNAEEYVAIQACIDDCKGCDVFVIATVNDKWSLPDSLTREGRFDKTIEVDIPDGDDAVKILSHYMKKKRSIEEIDVEEIAGILGSRSCASLETVINEAGMYAVYNGQDHIGREDMLKACIKAYFPCLIEEGTSGSQNKDLIWRVAIHEAGHATLHEALVPGSTTFVALGTEYNNDIRGITVSKKDKFVHFYQELTERKIMFCLAGMAASELFTGDHDLGNYSDLEKAFRLEKDMVLENATQGLECFKWMYSNERSDVHKDASEHKVASEIKRLYEETKKILIENRVFLESLANELVRHNYLTAKDIAAIKERVGFYMSEPTK